MNNTMTLAEMANSTNYATMNYAQLTELNFAFNWAIGQIKSFLPIKRREEMETVTKTYVTVMNGYCATQEEIIDCILKEKESLKDEPVINMSSNDVDDQESDVVISDEKKDDDGDLPALPDATLSSTEESETESSLAENNSADSQNDKTVPQEDKNQTIIEQAIEDAMARPVKDEIDINKAYFVDFSYEITQEGKLVRNSSFGHNLDSKDLEEFKSAGKKYVEYFLKGDVVKVTDNYLVYKRDESLIVRIFQAPIENGGEADPIESSSSDLISDEKAKKMKAKKHTTMKKAIEKAKKDALEEEDANTPFLYKCGLQFGKGFMTINRRLPKEYNDAATIIEMKKIAETYAKYYFVNAEVMSNQDGIAVMRGKMIDVIFFNIPIKNNDIDTPIKSTLKEKGEKSVKKVVKGKTKVKSESNAKKCVVSKTSKKDPRCIAITGTKDGETRTWNSFRECEKELGVSPGTASQVVSGKMKTAKGWILEKAV